MKLRIRGNSVRVRLTQSEVSRLATGKSVEQITEFSPTSTLVSLVKPTSQIRAATVMFRDGRLSVLLPLVDVRDWAQSNHVSIEASQAIGPDRALGILIEKDFECLHSRAEGNADAFPNPRSCAIPSHLTIDNYSSSLIADERQSYGVN